MSNELRAIVGYDSGGLASEYFSLARCRITSTSASPALNGQLGTDHRIVNDSDFLSTAPVESQACTTIVWLPTAIAKDVSIFAALTAYLETLSM